MLKHRFPIFDGDGHVYENDDELAQHFEGKWKGMARFKTFGLFPSLDGWSRGGFLAEMGDKRKYTYTDAKVWGEVLDMVGLEGSALYPTSGLAAGLMQDREMAVATCNAYNNWLETRYTAEDDRLYGVGLLAVQDPQAAAEEIERCATARVRFPAMVLPSSTSLSKSYGDPFFRPIFEAAEKHDIALAIHGAPSLGFGFNHFESLAKVHALEHPIPLFIQITDIIYSGVFDDFPKLRIGFLEGGSTWVPFMMDRLTYEYESAIGGELRERLKKTPDRYFSEGENIWVTLELGERFVRHTIDAMGNADRIFYATDYPHEPPDEEIVGDVPEFLENPDFDEATKRSIMGEAAKRFYRIS